MEMCESLNINFKTTSAESPWSNDLIERHNLILNEMLDKVLEESKWSFEVALAWCTNAKNSLQNVHGFSPFQLALSQNPKLPSMINDKLPAYTPQSSNKILMDNLNVIHKAREAFIMSENSERICRALNHNIRTSNDTKFLCGDVVYYKRANDRRWHGPGKVLGVDGWQVLVKHRSIYVCCHPCQVALETRSSSEVDIDDTSKKSMVKPARISSQLGTNIETSKDNDSDSDVHVVLIQNLKKYLRMKM